VLTVDLDLPRRVGLFETQAMPMLLDEGRRAAARALPQIEAALDRADTGAGSSPGPLRQALHA
jgi:hypothetical protein